MCLTFHCAGEIEGGRQTPPRTNNAPLRPWDNAQLAFSGQNTVAEALVASQGLGQGAVACSGRIRHAVSKIKQQFCVVMGLQKKTYNTQLTLPGHSTMAKALPRRRQGPG